MPVSLRNEAPLSAEEQATFRTWQRATLMFYGGLSILLVGLAFATGPAQPSRQAGQPVAHAALALAERQHR